MYRRSWIKIAVGFLLVATILGGFLRFLMFNPIAGIDFKNLLHAHSHVAFMGWIFNALFVALLYSFIPKDYEGGKKYHQLFLAFQLSVLGMLFSFPVQGYGAVSITFSTLHIVFSVVLAVFFVRDKNKIFPEKKPLSLQFALAGIFFLLLSSFGPFALGYGMANNMGHDFTQLSIYFYLHFQYDGWFTFAIFALFFRMLEREGIAYNQKAARSFFILMLLGCIPAYAGSTLWTQPEWWVFAAAVLANILQLAGLLYLFISLRGLQSRIRQIMSGWHYSLLLFAFGCFVFKMGMQAAGSIPFVADMAFVVRNFLIFYLHIIFLGFVSVFLFAWFGKYKLYQLKPTQGKLFLLAFVGSQLLMVAQPLLLMVSGPLIPYYHELMFGVSIFIPLSLLWNGIPQLEQKEQLRELVKG
ncbi:hypothetical protein [Nafulsella turpanensis]|uniref:hypothetical protein n=1 Tax=Nafulsella turpanensis TaxID=1265690 RepID=UPI00034CD5BC|nr:hypothetical protein [Nafulsella turpanensis]